MATGTMRMTPSEQQKAPVSIDLRLTDEQEAYLEKQFQKSKNPHPSEIMLTAAETGLVEMEVEAWFKQRVAMWRRDQGLPVGNGRVC